MNDGRHLEFYFWLVFLEFMNVMYSLFIAFISAALTGTGCHCYQLPPSLLSCHGSEFLISECSGHWIYQRFWCLFGMTNIEMLFYAVLLYWKVDSGIGLCLLPLQIQAFLFKGFLYVLCQVIHMILVTGKRDQSKISKIIRLLASCNCLKLLLRYKPYLEVCKTIM